uniref:Phorbol-ester/DAG-type domain-containing protein n=1 Tax=Trichuris muris TaxID=70415 RepID=A0A5S6QTU9_TRIMR
MDALSWLLLCWIGFAGLVYLLLQATFSAWPQATCDHVDPVMRGMLSAGAKLVSTEPTSSTLWINEVIRWLVERYCGTPDFVQQWLKSMNETARKQMDKETTVVFEEVYFPTPATSPVLSNIRAERGPRQHLTVRAHVTFESLILRLTASRIEGDHMVTQNFEAQLLNIVAETQVRLACLSNDFFAMGCFDGRPELLITVTCIDEKNQHKIIEPNEVEKLIRYCLMHAVTNVNLTMLKYVAGLNMDEIVRKLGDYGRSLIKAGNPTERSFSKRLSVRIVKASRIGGGRDVHKPYAVVELDMPSQNHVTAQSSGSDPFWDSHFMFQLTRESRELLFEVYDHISDSSKPVFLGLALISISELHNMSRPLQRFKLQGHPYSDEVVSGKIFVEFAFMNEIEHDALIQALLSANEVDLSKHIVPSSRGTSPPITRFLIHEDTMKLKLPQPQRRHISSMRLPVGNSVNFSDVGTTAISNRPLRTRTGSTKSEAGSSEMQPLLQEIRESNQLARNALSYSESETSVASDESLYQHSVLVVEVKENDIKKYYLVSAGLDKLPSVKKLIKRGKKLHIFNEHTFTATKVTSGHFCSVCMKTVRSTFRRQGYRCRDCRMLCHKQCHYKTETHCPSSNIFNLHIEPIPENMTQ